MTWTSEEVYAKDLQPGDRFTSRWAGDHTVAMQEACTVVTTGYRPLGGLSLEIEMPSGDHATRVFNAGNRVFRWTESSEASEEAELREGGSLPLTPRFTLTDEKDPDHPGILDADRPDMVATFGGSLSAAEWALKSLDAGAVERGLEWDARTTGEPEVAAAVKGLGPSDDTRASYAAEASEDSEDDFPTEIEKLKALELHLGIRDFHDDKILELRRELREMWDGA